MPSDLKVDLDTVSLDETVNGYPSRHFRITADATYPLPGGNRQVHQKVVVEQWLAKIPVNIVNPFGSRIRGLPDIPTTNGDYRAFLNTLAAANRRSGEGGGVQRGNLTGGLGGRGGQEYGVRLGGREGRRANGGRPGPRSGGSFSGKGAVVRPPPFPGNQRGAWARGGPPLFSR